MPTLTIEEAIQTIPPGWSLRLIQCDNDWSASLVHGKIAWQVGDRGETVSEAIQAVSSRVRQGRLYPEGESALCRR